MKLNPKEAEFVDNAVVSRLATASLEGEPHVTPVCHSYDGNKFLVATDYGTKKLRNLRANKKVCLTVDEYQGWGRNKGIVVQGKARILERGPEYLQALKLLYKKFPGYRRNSWKEGEAPIIVIEPTKIVSWGLKRS